MPSLIFICYKPNLSSPNKRFTKKPFKMLSILSYKYFPRESKYSCMKINKMYLPETKNFEQFLQKELFDNPLDFTNIFCIYDFPEINNFET